MEYVYLVFCSSFPDTYLVGIFDTYDGAEEFKQLKEEQETCPQYYKYFVDTAKINQEYSN